MALADPRSIRSRGFTLLEVLLSLALIALLATVFIGGAAHLMTDQPVTANDVFVKAVQEARKAALRSEHEIRLKYDKEKKQFLLFDGIAPEMKSPDGFVIEEKPRKQFPLPITVGTDLTVDFLPPASKSGGPAILVGGVLIETRQVKSVTFFPDGTCSPFRIQFVRNGAASIVAIDPWTCAPVLTDPNASTRY
jgi:prepilin-type N-terminal cleavage/methylation domain-containing protein